MVPKRSDEMDFVLDLNALGDDFTLRGMALEIFFSSLGYFDYSLSVPETTLDEFAARYRHKIRELNEWLDWVKQEYSRCGGRRQLFPTGFLPEEEEFQEFHNRQRSFLKAQGVEFLPFPELDPKLLIQKSIHQKLPFKDPTTGYRDCLVWFAMLQKFTGSSRPLNLISSSRAGFGNGKPSQIDLQSDLLEYKLDPEFISVVNSVDEANHRFLIPQMDTVSPPEIFMGENSQQFNLTHWIKEHLVSIAEAQGWSRQLAGMAETNARVIVQGIKEIQNTHLDDARHLDAKRYLLFAHVAAVVEVQVEYSARDYHTDAVLTEVLRPTDPTQGSVFLDMESVIAFSVLIEKDTMKVTKAEIDAVEGNGYQYQRLLHPWHALDGQKE